MSESDELATRDELWQRLNEIAAENNRLIEALDRCAQENHEKSHYWIDDRHDITKSFRECPVEECQARAKAIYG